MDAVTEKPDENRLAAELRQKLVSGLTRLVDTMLDDADDNLLGMADEAPDNRSQALHFDTMRVLRSHRPALLKAFRSRLQTSLEDLNQTPESTSSAGDSSELELQDMDSLEKSIAVTNMTARGLQLCGATFTELESRLRSLCKSTGAQIPSGAVSPAGCCACFQHAMDAIGLEIETQLLVYKLFELGVLPHLKPVYAELNALLDANGIAALRPRAPEPVSDDQRMPPALRPGADRSADTGARSPEVAGNGRSQSHGQARSAPPPPSARFARVISALNVMQGRVLAIHDDDLLAQNWVSDQLRGALQAVQQGDEQTQLPREQAQLFQMLNALFSDLLTDSNIAVPVKLLLARLQIPIIKVAMVNPEFFRSHSHPARELIGEVVAVGKRVQDEESVLFLRARSIVENLLREFDQDLRLVERAVVKLREFNIAESSATPAEATRRARTTHTANQAKEAVIRELTYQARDKNLPEALRAFVLRVWGPIMGLQYARHGGDSKQWRESSRLLSDLVASMQPADGGTSRADHHAPLLQQLRETLRAHGRSEAAIEQNLQELTQTWHRMDKQEDSDAVMETAPGEHTDVCPSGESVPERVANLLAPVLQPNTWYQLHLDAALQKDHNRWLKLMHCDLDADEILFANHRNEICETRSLLELAEEICTTRSRPIFASDAALHRMQADLAFALHTRPIPAAQKHL